MATQLQLRKGTTAEHSTFVGANGEVTVDTTKKALVLHDGVTAGGRTLPHLDPSDKIPIDQLPESTLSAKGVVQLDNTLTSTSTSKALTAAQGKVLGDRDFGVEQTWQDVTASRQRGTTYTNTTGRPIIVSYQINVSSATLSATVGGVRILHEDASDRLITLSFIVPNNMTYIIQVSGTTSPPAVWMELR